jgi:hypothetical protein
VTGYDPKHREARLVLPNECAHADGSCKGPLNCCLREGVPESMIAYEGNLRYYTGDPLDGYIRLCRSHHARYDKFHRNLPKDGRGGRALTPAGRASLSARMKAIPREDRVRSAAKVSPEDRTRISVAQTHARWHRKRNQPNLECQLCQEEFQWAI